jgi:hypothetical protein
MSWVGFSEGAKLIFILAVVFFVGVVGVIDARLPWRSADSSGRAG